MDTAESSWRVNPTAYGTFVKVSRSSYRKWMFRIVICKLSTIFVVKLSMKFSFFSLSSSLSEAGSAFSDNSNASSLLFFTRNFLSSSSCTFISVGSIALAKRNISSTIIFTGFDLRLDHGICNVNWPRCPNLSAIGSPNRSNDSCLSFKSRSLTSPLHIPIFNWAGSKFSTYCPSVRFKIDATRDSNIFQMLNSTAIAGKARDIKV